MNKARKPLIVGNWKMHHGGLSAIGLAAECVKIARECPHVEVVVAPPFTAIAAVSAEAHGSPLKVAAQNVHAKDKGAYTGEVCASMLVEAGCEWVILGHSERRQLFAESDQSVAEKTSAVLAAKLLPIVCVGETLAQREAGQTLDVVKTQVNAVLDILAKAGVAASIAYEPVWAIGTGKNASPADAEEVHASIRKLLAAEDPKLAEQTRILYGAERANPHDRRVPPSSAPLPPSAPRP